MTEASEPTTGEERREFAAYWERRGGLFGIDLSQRVLADLTNCEERIDRLTQERAADLREFNRQLHEGDKRWADELAAALSRVKELEAGVVLYLDFIENDLVFLDPPGARDPGVQQQGSMLTPEEYDRWEDALARLAALNPPEGGK